MYIKYDDGKVTNDFWFCLQEGGTDNAGSDLLKKENLDKLKEMLEPFKNQNPGGMYSHAFCLFGILQLIFDI